MNLVISLLLLSFSFSVQIFATSYAEDNDWNGYIGPHTLEKMKMLALRPSLKFEEYIKNEEQTFPWLTLKNTVCTNPKTSQKEDFIIVNAYDKLSENGQFVLYKNNIDLTKICLKNLREFTDAVYASAFFLSKISYHYDGKNGYITIDHVSSGNLSGGQGYAQVCLNTFLNQFIRSHTQVKYVFADLRTPVTQHYFPKYGFQKGFPDNLKLVPVGLNIPYFSSITHELT